ncbi:hypothetical protein ACS0TY_002314 [Phlomoides rotata]
MEGRIPSGSYFQYAPTGPHAPLQRSSSLTDPERYLTDLLAERQKVGPFMQSLPVCSRLLNQEIMRISGLISNKVAELERMGHEYPYNSFNQQPNGGQISLMSWNPMQTEEDKLLQKMAPFQPSSVNWHVPGTPTTPVVKRVIRLDIPVEKYPNYNFVGRILGPRGNSLKRVEAMTGCRIFIRGQGSVKDSLKEEKLKDKPGYEHLNEPLHLLLEGEYPEDIMEARLDNAISILENLLKPVVCIMYSSNSHCLIHLYYL